MQPIFENKTVLTADLYLDGIKEYYKVGHKVSRVISVAYSLILIWCAGMLLSDFNLIVGIPFLAAGIIIIFWQFKGYMISSKKSFKQFALLHQSHYQVDMDYRFYEDRLEQETEKTELTVLYENISKLYNFRECLLFVYDKKVIIMDKEAFVKGSVEEIIALMEQKKVKIQ